MHTLIAAPLTRAAFAPFGEVVELRGAAHFPINLGTTERFHDLARIDVDEAGGRPLLNVFRGQPRALPVAITMMERHTLGSQTFVPLTDNPYLIVVAPAGAFDPTRLRAFHSVGWQGVHYARGVWHHPLLALHRVSDFIVVDRGGAQADCEEVQLAMPCLLAFDAALQAVADPA